MAEKISVVPMRGALQETITPEDSIRELVEVPKDDFGLHRIYERAQAVQAECTDHIVSKVNSRNMRLDEDNAGLLHFVGDDGVRGKISSGWLRPHSLGQLCTKLEIPTRYIEKCYKDGNVHLAAENVNAWLDSYGKSLLVRKYGDGVRGILSNRFMVLDAPDIIQSLIEAFDAHGSDSHRVKGFTLNEERFHARVILNDQLNIPGEDLFLGLQVDSSDVGRSVISVKVLLYKQVCTNGLCITKGNFDLFRKRHLGNSIPDFRLGFQEAIARLPEFSDQVREIVKQASGSGLGRLFEANKQTTVEGITKLMQRWGLKEKEIDRLIPIATSGAYTSSAWGLVNSITDMAKGSTLERRIEIETIASNFLLDFAAVA